MRIDPVWFHEVINSGFTMNMVYGIIALLYLNRAYIENAPDKSPKH